MGIRTLIRRRSKKSLIARHACGGWRQPQDVGLGEPKLATDDGELGVSTWSRGNIVRATRQPKRDAAMLGVGLDNDDGHVRLTKGKNFALVGGSQDTHTQMQETVVKINEQLDNRGKRLEDVSVREFSDICHEVRESIG